MEKPTLPKGTRDFGPVTMGKRQFIFESIRTIFRKYGFLPLETPAMENLSVLTGKYGEEGDQLLFRILNSGDFLKEFREQIRLSDAQLKELFALIDTELGIEKIKPLNKIEAIVESVADKITFHSEVQKELLTGLIKLNKENFAEKIFSLYSDTSTRKEPVQVFTDQFNKLGVQLDGIHPSFLRDFISEKGLRYDLTVPFARYVVMNRHEIALPFKRYQMQPVWRADRPQKGRYREFYQCDADVVGTHSLICEAEIILMIREVFNLLGIGDYTIKINHRNILAGIAETLNATGKETELYTAIDKLDKIGANGVREELKDRGFEEASINRLFTLLTNRETNHDTLNFLSDTFKNSEKGLMGQQDLEEVLRLLSAYGTNDDHVQIDTSLARGLSYYTGTIFEVKINSVAIGSVSGGGRYDNLTQAFGSKEPLPGIGISFGVDRLYDAMEELGLFPKETRVSSKILICHMNKETIQYSLGILSKIREADIACEIYPDESKLKKQLDYANKKLVPYAIVIGMDEIKSGYLTFKDMGSGQQEQLTLEQIIQKVKQ